MNMTYPVGVIAKAHEWGRHRVDVGLFVAFVICYFPCEASHLRC